jgi:hypothetical protein
MLQRIQSLYLLIAILLLTLTLIYPLVEFISNGGDMFYLSSIGLYPKEINNETNLILRPNYLLLIIDLLVLVTMGVVIFFYKRRALQIRLLYLITTIIFAFYGAFFFYFNRALSLLNTSSFSFKAIIILPLLSIVLIYLAIVAIRKDDNLIKSVDRLR